MEKLRVTKVNYQDKDKDGNPLKGKYGPYFRIGLLTDKYGETWINGFAKTNCKDMEGKEVELEVFDEEYQGKSYKKFKFPAKMVTRKEFDELKEKVAKIEFHLAKPTQSTQSTQSTKVAGTDVDYPEPSAEEIPW